jgi:hypothetical protein
MTGGIKMDWKYELEIWIGNVTWSCNLEMQLGGISAAEWSWGI